MALKIKLQPLGRKKRHYFRIVVNEERSKRDGNVVEVLGYFHPKEKNKTSIDSERIKYWISKGAKLTESLQKKLNL